VTKVRRRTIWEQQGRRGRKIDPAWANRRRLLTGRQRLRPKAFTAMWNSLTDADPSGQILAAWIAKDEPRTLLALARTDASRDQIAASSTSSTTGARPRSPNLPWTAAVRPTILFT
jgi:hypothetical protein